MKKILFAFYIIIIFQLFMISGCKKINGASKVDKKELKGQIIYSSNRTDFENSILKDYAKEFQKKYPNTKIKIETIKDYVETMKIKMSSNNLPDIWTIHGNSYTQDAMQNYNVNLSSKFPDIVKDYIDTDVFKGRDGNNYGVATGVTYDLVIYNKKIFKEVNVDIPETLNEFIDIAKKIKKEGYIPLGTAAADNWPLRYYFTVRPLELSGDNDILNKLAKKSKPFTNENSVYKSYSILKKFVDAKIMEKKPLSSKWETMKKDYQSGKVAMVLLGTWFIPQACEGQLKLDDIGVFPFPYDNVKGNRFVLRGPDVGIGIAKNSDNMKLAGEFFKFMTEEKCIDFAQKCGLGSPRKSKKVNLSWLKDFEKYDTEIISMEQNSAELKDIVNKLQFGEGEKVAQKIIAGKSLKSVFEELNIKWAAAK